jgi:hypothetical protein
MLFVLTSVYMQFGLGLAAENAKYSPAVPGEHPKVSVADDYLIGLVLRRSHFARFGSKKDTAWCRQRRSDRLTRRPYL